MAVTKTSIANMSLGHLGVSKEIADLETENSAEAIAMRRTYDVALDETLSDFDWPFARKFADLTLVEEDPTEEWRYSYNYPPDCVMLRRILSGTRNETEDSKIPFILADNETETVVFTDKEDATGAYTKRVTNPQLYPAGFVMAFSLKLAKLNVRKLSKGDPFKIANDIDQDYQVAITKASSRKINEEQPEKRPESEFIRARE